jgi:hypothetical protein
MRLNFSEEYSATPAVEDDYSKQMLTLVQRTNVSLSNKITQHQNERSTSSLTLSSLSR